jgi:hypothetical protein
MSWFTRATVPRLRYAVARMAVNEPPIERARCAGEPGTLTLWFEQFRDIAVMGVALTGGVITLLGTVFTGIRIRPSVVVSIAFLIGAAVTALIGQTHVVDLAERSAGPDGQLRKLRKYAFLLLAGGFGAFIAFALMTFVRMAAQSPKP